MNRFAKQGNTQIHSPTLDAICKALDIQPSDVLTYEQDEDTG
ncbi:MAG: hypothetical protein DWQ04_06530 [Chloroflexi bacterium]|nr:MAG: hypothetical protein DWQ04_06530 [Chloroflexota bacterium]